MSAAKIPLWEKRKIKFKDDQLTVHWSDSTTDYFQAAWFKSSQQVYLVHQSHDFKGSDPKHPAFCDVSVRTISEDGKYLCVLDYTPYKEENQIADCYLGVSELVFRVDGRNAIALTAKRFTYLENGTRDDGRVDLDFDDQNDLSVDDVVFSSSEGRARLVAHQVRERDARLRFEKLRRANDRRCEACGFSYSNKYKAGVGDDYIEIHHLKQLKAGYRESMLKDLVLLCANCHRMIHRAMVKEKSFEMSKEDFVEKYLYVEKKRKQMT